MQSTPLYSRFFMRAISYQNKEFELKEPFKGLFTQGMVCHETYKDSDNKWRSPDEVKTDDGKNYFLKSDNSNKNYFGPIRVYVKIKKTL